MRLVLVALATLIAGSAFAQENKKLTPEQFTERSLALRTALHRAPMLGPPLDRLLEMYRKENKLTELLDIYRNHLAEYPQDFRATTVLVRLLSKTGDKEALNLAKNAVTRFATDANLHTLYGEILKRKNDLEWLSVFDKAVELETDPNRRLTLIETLLPEAVKLARKTIAEKQVKRLIALASNAQSRLTIARSLNKFDFHKQALELATKKEANVPPETMVDLEIEAAEAEAGLRKTRVAAARLDALLGRLAADYWRRPQILKRRLALVGSSEEARKIVDAAKSRVKKAPTSETAWLDLGRTLAGLDFHREALDELLKAGDKLPNSQEIETEALRLFELLRDDARKAEYLAKRIKAFPARTNLALERCRTLYRLGKEEAATAFAELIKPLKAEKRSATQLEMARFLRRVHRDRESAAIFAQVVKESPERLDVMRELAESYIKRADRYRVRELMRNEIPKTARLENVIDLVQFLIKEEFDVEARQILRARTPAEPANVELRTLLLKVERRLGNFRAGNALIVATRKIADTPAKYRLWLQSAAEFHDEIGEGDELDKFLQKEVEAAQAEEGAWDTRRLEKLSALTEALAKNDQSVAAERLLRSAIDQIKDKALTLKFRKQLVKILDRARDPNATQSRIAELESLAKDDPTAASDYMARIAIAKTTVGLHNEAEEIFKKLDISTIGDVELLSELKMLARTSLQRGHGYTARNRMYLPATERLTILNPTDRENWEDWLSVLAQRGDEEQFRASVRRLLAGIDKLPISEPTRDLLEWHLSDSYWRSLSRLISEDADASYREALPLLDEAARLMQDDARWLWVAWTRAFVLNRLSRTEARDAAWTELERVAERVKVQPVGRDGKPLPKEKQPKENEDCDVYVLFPDGQSASLAQAKRLAFSIPETEFAKVNGRTGALGSLKLAWAFDLPKNELADCVVPLTGNRVLIRSASDRFWCVDGVTGKVVWERDASELGLVNVNPIAHSYINRPEPMVIGDSILFAGISRVICIAAADGQTRWKVRTKPIRRDDRNAAAQVRMARVFLFRHEKDLLAYDARYAALLRIDPETGKVKWERWYNGKIRNDFTPNRAGASLSGDKLLIYASPTAILDAASGEVLWAFDPVRVRSYPFKLEEPDDDNETEEASIDRALRKSVPVVQPGPIYPTGSGYPIYSGSGKPWSYPPSYTLSSKRVITSFGAPSPQPTPRRQTVNVLSPTGAITLQSVLSGEKILVPPAVQWAEYVRTGSGFGVLAGDWMLFRMAGSYQLYSISTSVPFRATNPVPPGIPGEYLGSIGRVACFLNTQSKSLQMMRLATNKVSAVDLSDLMGKPPHVGMLQARMDGPIVYIAGETGLVAVNVLSAKRIFKTAWPADAVDANVKAAIKTAKPKPVLTAGSPGPPAHFGRMPISSFSRRSFTSPPLMVRQPVRGIQNVLNTLNSRAVLTNERGPRAIAITKDRIYAATSYRRVVAFDVSE